MRNWQSSPEARNEFCIEGDVIWIKLTQGQETCVDLEDWDRVKGFKWASVKSSGGKFYAGTHLALHSLVLGKTGQSRKAVTDHKNGVTLDNRKSELRAASTSQNNVNTKLAKNNTSGFRGVSWRGWQAGLGVDNKLEYLGFFDNPVEAAMAYDRAALEKYGEFARLNFPRGQFGAFAL